MSSEWWCERHWGLLMASVHNPIEFWASARNPHGLKVHSLSPYRPLNSVTSFHAGAFWLRGDSTQSGPARNPETTDLWDTVRSPVTCEAQQSPEALVPSEGLRVLRAVERGHPDHHLFFPVPPVGLQLPWSLQVTRTTRRGSVHHRLPAGPQTQRRQ